MNLKPYKPSPIEGYKVSLTARQKLAHVRKVLADVRTTRRYWPDAEWNPLLFDLQRQETALADEIKRIDLATFGKTYLRPEFISCKSNLTTRIIVRHPNDEVDMPHIPEAAFDAMRRILNDPDGDGIEVNADYDVYVCRGRYPIRIIPRYE